MTGLCKYKDSLGIAGKGIHFHVFGIAIVDLIMTICIAALITFFYKPIKTSRLKSFLIILVSLFIIAIFLHWLFCVPTAVNKFLHLYVNKV
jgi:hypothetical protein